jgi:pimeloyl-ACP methyl ester carboxylesterase
MLARGASAPAGNAGRPLNFKHDARRVSGPATSNPHAFLPSRDTIASDNRPMDTLSITRAGRTISVHRTSGGAGRTILFCHAAPGAGNFDPDPEQTARRGITLVGPDRPGYGASDPVTGEAWASVDGAADDAVAALDAAGVTQPIGVVGWSAGGRVALALAARRPELVDRVSVVATPAPHEDVPWIPPDQAAGLEAMRGLPPAQVHATLTEQLAAMVPPDPRSAEALQLVGASSADDAVLADDGASKRLGEMMAAGLAQGAVGMAQDIAGYCLQPWGFEPGEVVAKTLLLYGSADPLSGQRHGTWWQKHLPNARLEMVPGAGHLVIVPMWRRVLSFLAPASGSS